MKSKSIYVVLLAAALLAPATFTGCSTTPATREAKVYYTFKDTWSVAHTAYQGWCERVVLGKVSKEQERAVDAAWNTFRASFKTAFAVARNDWSNPSPQALAALQEQLLTLIRQNL